MDADARLASGTASPIGPGFPSEETDCIRRLLLAAIAAVLLLPSSAPARTNCRSLACFHRVQVAQWKRVARPYWAAFERIAQCESTSRWHLQNGNGYEGGLQWVHSSWLAVGGSGSAAQASKAEQIYRGVLLMRRAGWGSWPVCRHAAGV